jgi:NAD+ synthase
VLEEFRRELLGVDWGRTAEAVEVFITEKVDGAGVRGVVLGLSGGVDSSVVATLCVRALSPDRVLGLVMPAEFTPTQDVQDAETLAKNLGIETVYAPIKGVVDGYAAVLGVGPSDATRIPYANLRARIRMSILYFYANLRNLLVVGTGDRSEILLGYYTKYGDGGVDFLPVGNIYKTQLRMLGKHLGLPDSIAFKPSSPQLYPGHRAVDELPADYDTLDPILYALFDKNMSADTVVGLGADRRVVEAVVARFKGSMHKREMPPVGPRPVKA